MTAKTDLNLGIEVHNYLMEQGVESPIVLGNSGIDANDQAEIGKHFRSIMELIGLDMTNDSLKDTPERVAKMFSREIFTGLNYENFPKCTTQPNEFGYHNELRVYDIKSMSTCEHHFVTIHGYCTVKYIPADRVLGLSKFHRIVDFFSRRPQVQERLTLQIFHALCFILKTKNVHVEIKAEHLCVKSRGVENHDSDTHTSWGGGYYDVDDYIEANLTNGHL